MRGIWHKGESVAGSEDAEGHVARDADSIWEQERPPQLIVNTDTANSVLQLQEI